MVDLDNAHVSTSLTGSPPSGMSVFVHCAASVIAFSRWCCMRTSSHAHGSVAVVRCGALGGVGIGIAHNQVVVQPGLGV
jgi:hypothetical protein